MVPLPSGCKSVWPCKLRHGFPGKRWYPPATTIDMWKLRSLSFVRQDEVKSPAPWKPCLDSDICTDCVSGHTRTCGWSAYRNGSNRSRTDGTAMEEWNTCEEQVMYVQKWCLRQLFIVCSQYATSLLCVCSMLQAVYKSFCNIVPNFYFKLFVNISGHQS